MVSFTKVPLILLLLIPVTFILISFGIILGSISFYVSSSETLGPTLYDMIITFSQYPGSIFTGATKFITLFIIPAGFITSVPVDLLYSFNLTWFVLLFLFSIALFLLAIYVFYKGLKRYESGNLMYVRM